MALPTLPTALRASLQRGALPLTLLLAALAAASPLRAQRPLLRLQPAGPRALQLGAFELTSPADVHIDAVGAPAQAFYDRSRGVLAKLVGGLRIDVDRAEGAWAANAWILDARTRKPVWELSRADGKRLRDDLRQHRGTVRLPAGIYEVYYATAAPSVTREGRRVTWSVADDVVERLGITIVAPGRVLSGPALQQARAATSTDVVVTLSGAGHDASERVGFELTRPAVLEVTMTGEADGETAFDHGWIINADTREKVWSFRYADSEPAGGASKNRVARAILRLPAGRYAALYVTDDSHAPSEWNSAPPYDPLAWGLQVRVADAAARAGIRRFEYELLPRAQLVTSIARVGSNEARRSGFALSRPADVRLFALGEAASDELEDYAWIIDAESRAVVWMMERGRTEPAGGASKNRLFDGLVRLPAGRYEVHYVTDGSHAFDDWNDARPRDAEYWGVAVLAARPGDRAAFEAYDPARDPSIIAQLVGVRDEQRARRSFRMEQAGSVRVYALGEGHPGEMFDYAWIEEAGTRRVVWEMNYDATQHAGGAAKNRVFDGIVHLPAGSYLLNYRSDDSHSFGDWNESPPRDPAMWGVTLRRASR